VANEEHAALLKQGVEVSRADLLSGLHDPLLSVRWPHPFGLTQHRSDAPGVGDDRWSAFRRRNLDIALPWA
jgi:hypothetical protein